VSWSAKDEVITESRTPSDMARTKQGKRKSVAGEFHWSALVRLYKLNPVVCSLHAVVTHSLKAPGFQPLSL
jgi:hypothetical protein